MDVGFMTSLIYWDIVLMITVVPEQVRPKLILKIKKYELKKYEDRKTKIE